MYYSDLFNTYMYAIIHLQIQLEIMYHFFSLTSQSH